MNRSNITKLTEQATINRRMKLWSNPYIQSNLYTPKTKPKPTLIPERINAVYNTLSEKSLGLFNKKKDNINNEAVAIKSAIDIEAV